MINDMFRKGFILLACASVLCSCGDSKARIPADAPGFIKGKAVHPTIKIGKPYRIGWKRYYPEYDPEYDETGMASWYGPNFHGKSTANGEKFNQWAMTAAHTTLPLPSMVRVTNLKTNKSVVVRINDRGPFAESRVIDLSRAAAEELGTRARGVAKVRVQYLKEETEAYIAKLQLKKPKKMLEIDAARKSTSSPAIKPPPQIKELASQVPQQFAYESVEEITSTVSVRGVEMQEIGYAEDAFSVLRGSIANPTTLRPQQIASWQHPTQQPQRYFVRAGTFSSKKNAYDLAEKVGSVAATQVTPLDINGRDFWRVSLGPAFNRGIAEGIRDKLTHHAIYDAAIERE